MKCTHAARFRFRFVYRTGTTGCIGEIEMIDINELRRKLQSGDLIDRIDIHANVNPVLTELLDRLETAEKERDWKAERLEDAIEECAALRAKVEAMEQQEPARDWWDRLIADISAIDCMYRDVVWMLKKRRDALPGAQPAPMAVAYLDIGANGYMDIGTDLTDEELDTIPKGRHMLGIVGTYGIEGYVPAQPAPTIAEQDQINAEAAIRSIYGARPNDEAKP